ncbi:MAG: MFS transporter [Chromatiaceae bacterium]|nr:MFS transporter [Gammaproteobacteria bacterium]MCB1860550.1 MFS transporter [Gammaproteobacteria bacterium]MCB1879289.1 MFS transporter [Gammaproteobacteria bacterium]MCP5426666.1 MFS transporter [Chromatiaceae bacterium]MCP5446482.1 MFS transporter [Chromatiaceae bacterium]
MSIPDKRIIPDTVNSTWRNPELLLMLMAGAMAASFSVWQALLNNFVVERAAFTGAEIGLLQSLREIPGFLAFTVVFVLLLVREQALAIAALALTGIGVALTGQFPHAWGLYCTTLIMSVGFHYYETLQQSLTLQWIDKARAPIAMGLQISARSIAAIGAFIVVWLGIEVVKLDYAWLYLFAGSLTVGTAAAAWLLFPAFPQKTVQHKTIILRRRYWLYYALTFMGGARRQIFVVFAAFMMVERFGFGAGDIALLFLLNHLINTWLAPRIGRLIRDWGERRALTLEYIGLVVIFSAYAFVDIAWVAALLYIADHLFFAMAIGIRSYFQKIADPADIASSAGVAFSINHIAAVIIPVLFGVLWLTSPAAVFLAGAVMALISLALARLIPEEPQPGMETTLAAPPLSEHT